MNSGRGCAGSMFSGIWKIFVPPRMLVLRNIDLTMIDNGKRVMCFDVIRTYAVDTRFKAQFILLLLEKIMFVHLELGK